MYLRHENIAVPNVYFNNDIESLTVNVRMLSNGLRDTIDNVQDISCFIEGYVNDTLIKYEKQITEKIASKTYDIISEMIECNIRKEEFVNLLLHDEMSDADG